MKSLYSNCLGSSAWQQFHSMNRDPKHSNQGLFRGAKSIWRRNIENFLAPHFTAGIPQLLIRHWFILWYFDFLHVYQLNTICFANPNFADIFVSLVACTFNSKPKNLLTKLKMHKQNGHVFCVVWSFKSNLVELTPKHHKRNLRKIKHELTHLMWKSCN